jgi:hypothetical protein
VAEIAYKEAQQEYDKLRNLHQLKIDYDAALVKKQQLQEKYQAACVK